MPELQILIKLKFLPLSCVAGPGFTHGNNPGHKYPYSSILRPTIPKPKLSNGAVFPVGAPWTLPMFPFYVNETGTCIFKAELLTVELIF